MTSFTSFDLPAPVVGHLTDTGITAPFPIQAATLPDTLRGRDVLGRGRTGSGKTLAFALPLVTRLAGQRRTPKRPRGLVLVPTRELAAQVHDSIVTYGKYENIRSTVVFGGVKINPQMMKLRGGVEILVATPGRLLDLYQQKAIRFDQVEVLILDEADRMLDMGFIPQVRRIVRLTPRKEHRQTLLFSATFSDDVLNLSNQWTLDPARVEIEPESVATDTVDQKVFLVTERDKFNLLYNLISEDEVESVIVFANRRDQCRKLQEKLSRCGFKVGLLSGDVPQNKRVRTLDDFKSGKLQVLVATDVAGRGIHIDGISHVVNCTLPEEPEDYVHRIGRTGRAGRDGLALSLCAPRELPRARAIEERVGEALRWDKLQPLSGRATDVPAAAMATLRIDGGRGDKLPAGDIVGALTGEAGLPKDAIGRIDVFATRSYVAITRRHAPRALDALRAGRIKGRRFRVSPL